MTQNKLFLHGVPDTPSMWSPLFQALGIDKEDVHCPPLPGFTQPAPKGFPATKEAYTDWLIAELETLYAKMGPVDIVGHDWGAILTLRATSLRPELIRTWAVGGAVIHGDYSGHRVARIWNTFPLGEVFMAITSQSTMKRSLQNAGLPEALAATEASHWSPSMKRSILKLYRSANGLRFDEDWVTDLNTLPEKGLVLWGEQDPYVDTRYGIEFAKERNVPFQSKVDAGHWIFVEQAEFCAARLQQLWS